MWLCAAAGCCWLLQVCRLVNDTKAAIIVTVGDSCMDNVSRAWPRNHAALLHTPASRSQSLQTA
jgi:hypothetical protein